MPSGTHLSHSPADGTSKKRFIVSLVVVLSVHLLIFALIKSPPAVPEQPKAERFVIELGKAPPAGAAAQQAVEPPGAQAAAPSKTPPAPPTPRTAATATNAPSQTPSPTPPKEGQTIAAASASAQSTSSDLPAQPSNPTAKAPAAEPAAQGAKAPSDSMRTAEPDYKAAYLNNPRPPYPRNAHRFGIEGQVILQAEVNEEGVPVRVQVFQSSGNDLLDESALTTVAKWRFSPARKDGAMVRAVVKIPITFSLKATSLR